MSRRTRTTSSSGTFAASISVPTKVVSAVAGLSDYLKATILLNPRGLRIAESIPDTVTVTEIVLRATKNPELQHRLYMGDAVPLNKVMPDFSREALGISKLTDLEFSPDHGMELEITYENAPAQAETFTVLWAIDNAHGAIHTGARPKLFPGPEDVQGAAEWGKIPDRDRPIEGFKEKVT